MHIIHNAKIHTLDSYSPSATAIAIERDRIIAIGSDADILESFSGPGSLNANGRTIIPGLTDAHIHLEQYALSLQKVNCETLTRQECLQRVAARVITAAPGEWILGHGWNQNNWVEGYGDTALLDEIAPQNPVYLTHKSLHSAWANSMALHLAGINQNTVDPAGGRIGRLPNGEPDGILFETATDLLEATLPEPSLEQVVRSMQTAIPFLWQMGLTGVHDFDHRMCFAALQVLHQQGMLKLRVLKGIQAEDLQHALEIGIRSGFGDDILRIGSLKLFADGALGPHTAAMIEPYDDDPQNLGILNMDEDELVAKGRQAVANGISLAIHAIGDRANRTVLNAYAQLREFENGFPRMDHKILHHRIEHVQVLHPDDLGSFSKHKIMASMQPIHATSDMLMANRCWGKRSTYAYAWRSVLANNIPLIFGSDAPVESPNPFWGIHAAVTRRRADGSPGLSGWHPEQRLSVGEAMHAYTSTPAFAAGIEDRLGKLAPGYLADLLVLDADPYSCEPEALANIQPLATMVGGEWVHSRLG